MRVNMEAVNTEAFATKFHDYDAARAFRRVSTMAEEMGVKRDYVVVPGTGKNGNKWVIAVLAQPHKNTVGYVRVTGIVF